MTSYLKGQVTELESVQFQEHHVRHDKHHLPDILVLKHHGKKREHLCGVEVDGLEGADVCQAGQKHIGVQHDKQRRRVVSH